VEVSAQAGAIVQGEQAGTAMAELRQFMFDRVYLGPEATREHRKIELVIGTLFDYYCSNPDEIPPSIPPGQISRRVTDYIAGMTDRFCIRTFEQISVPVAFTP
jgi:dGTPase